MTRPFGAPFGAPAAERVVRALVVDDSASVRARIVEVLEADPGVEVVGVASDGQTAITMCEQLRPDVVTMDMVLPGVTGLAATEYLMEHCPTPILVLSSAENRGELISTAAALAAGAVDVLDKPDGSVPMEEWERKLLEAVKLVARIKVITHLGLRDPRHHPRPRVPAQGSAAGLDPALPGPGSGPGRLDGLAVVGIGASTGGPGAVAAVLAALPRPFPVPVLITLHVNAAFVESLTDWLRTATGHDVRIAHGGEVLAGPSARGLVLVAPADKHLVVHRGRSMLTHTPPRQSCRPSVDELFESLATEYGPHTAACLLTGMGRDGAAGLLAIRRAGGATVAQDEETSVVYGMPREAVLRGAARYVLPVERVGAALASFAGLNLTGPPAAARPGEEVR
ncbi:chemotaxis-specific protein-glutamate methyltransferase CheB [Spongisporangium articulatum]|uniref:Protein-glutamate methylesterase/protein-glutamine glutaminase n=1 Tax=Spongisporangium articulatum TaxID=3362603 RepID=A0ABW8AKI7_9ACTN